MSIEINQLLGTDLAGYRIESVIGRGGMGVVYLATDLRLERKVALKLVAPQLAGDAHFRERFLRESRLAASLDHSHIVPVYGAGETDGQLWIAMRYVQGTDLKTLLEEEGPLQPARAVALCSHIGEALDAAHEHGLVHRDVKPANVLVTQEGGEEHCYLADFGLARTADLEAGAGTGAHLSGSVDYTAPEQITAEPADQRSDVYSLGCVLFECMAGEPPFKRPRPVATLFAHTSEPPPSLHEWRPELPEAIDQVIAKALAKNPDERNETCGELVRAAGQALGLGGPRFTRRQVLLAGAGAAVAVAAAAAVPALLLSRRHGTAAPKAILPLADTSLVRVDPASAELISAVELGGAPTQVVAGLGSVWIIDPRENVIKEIEPSTTAVARTIDLNRAGSPLGVVVGDDALWVVTDGETIDRQVTWRLEPGPLSLSRFAESPAVSVEGHSVWLADFEQIDTFAQVDVDTGQVLATIRVPRLSSAINLWAVWPDREMVWITYQEAPSLLRRLDPATGDVVEEILVGPVETILAGSGEIWVATNDGSVVRIDPDTNQITDTIEVTRSPKQLVLGGGSLWVADARDPIVARVDPETGDVFQVRVGGTPLSMAFGEGALWVIVRPS
jgi:serine/threonine-protein kinase